MRIVKYKFKNWLKSKDPDEFVSGNKDVVGLSWCDTCPLATYLNSEYEGSYWVGTTMFGKDGAVRNSNLPEWAQEFVDAVDDSGSRKFTAREALKALK